MATEPHTRADGHGDQRRQRWLIAAIGAVIYLFAAVPLYADSLEGPRGYTSDFGRDAAGAELVRIGETPYQIVELRVGPTPHPLLEDDGWIAHSPASLAMARALTAVASVDEVERVLELLALLVPLILGVALAQLASTGPALRVTLVFLPAAGIYAIENVVWLQFAGVVGLGVLAVLHLSGRRSDVGVVAVLGSLVALKVWPAFLAITAARHPWRTMLRVGAVATIASLAVLPWTGGPGALVDWLLEALPSNTAEHTDLSFSLASAIGSPGALSLVIYTVAMIGATTLVRPSDLRVGISGLLHIALAPLVWPWMVLALLPALVWPIVKGRTDPVLVGACLAMPVIGLVPVLADAIGVTTYLVRETMVVGQIVAFAGWWLAMRRGALVAAAEAS